jgi:hypothetical protein
MSSTLAIQIGGFILLWIALAVSFQQVDRVLKQRDQAFKDQGAPGASDLERASRACRGSISPNS